MNKIKIMFTALLVSFSFSALSAVCILNEVPQQRLQILGETLVNGDVLDLTIGGYNVSYTVNVNSEDASSWPKFLALQFNTVVPGTYAKAGNPLTGYKPTESSTVNVIDIFDANTVTSLTKNGQDYSTQLVSQIIPNVTYSNSRYIPGWQTKYISTSLQTYLTISNTQNHEVNLQVVLFDQNGNQYDESSDAGTQLKITPTSGMIGDPLSSTGATLLAHSTASIAIISGTAQHFGYGYIKWSSDICTYSALVAQMQRHLTASSGFSGSQVLLNAGQSF